MLSGVISSSETEKKRRSPSNQLYFRRSRYSQNANREWYTSCQPWSTNFFNAKLCERGSPSHEEPSASIPWWLSLSHVRENHLPKIRKQYSTLKTTTVTTSVMTTSVQKYRPSIYRFRLQGKFTRSAPYITKAASEVNRMGSKMSSKGLGL